MTDKIKEFIEENIHLIEEDKWEEIYRKSDALKHNIGEFTEFMLSADIHPEKYLTDLPIYFLFGSNISEFEIPNNIENIGKYAFMCCFDLVSIVIPDNIISIGESAFEHCYSLKSISIPDAVREISWHAFSDCTSLTSVIIPGSVVHIDKYAFFECKDLNITYAGTKEQWQNLAKSKFSGVTYTCNCIDGIIKKSR